MHTQPLIGKAAPQGSTLCDAEVVDLVSQACPVEHFRQKKVLLIIPDSTRTAPVGLLFKTLFNRLGSVTHSFDILVALGTHQPMSEQAICERLEITLTERQSAYGKVQFYNHA